jgi:hypothetical protein
MKLRVWFHPKIPFGEVLTDRQVLGVWLLRPVNEKAQLLRCQETVSLPDGSVFMILALSDSKPAQPKTSLQLAAGDGAPLIHVVGCGQLSAAVAIGKFSYLNLELLPAAENEPRQ